MKLRQVGKVGSIRSVVLIANQRINLTYQQTFHHDPNKQKNKRDRFVVAEFRN